MTARIAEGGKKKKKPQTRPPMALPLVSAWPGTVEVPMRFERQ
jgi:hypothetical protein